MPKTQPINIFKTLLENRNILGELSLLIKYKNKKNSYLAVFCNQKGYYAINIIFNKKGYKLVEAKSSFSFQDSKICGILSNIKQNFDKEKHEVIYDVLYFKQLYL